MYICMHTYIHTHTNRHHRNAKSGRLSAVPAEVSKHYLWTASDCCECLSIHTYTHIYSSVFHGYTYTYKLKTCMKKYTQAVSKHDLWTASDCCECLSIHSYTHVYLCQLDTKHVFILFIHVMCRPTSRNAHAQFQNKRSYCCECLSIHSYTHTFMHLCIYTCMYIHAYI